jgi:hypothetical protein
VSIGVRSEGHQRAEMAQRVVVCEVLYHILYDNSVNDDLDFDAPVGHVHVMIDQNFDFFD